MISSVLFGRPLPCGLAFSVEYEYESLVVEFFSFLLLKGYFVEVQGLGLRSKV